ncbi:MAG TPA: OmpA family protein [Candidatus Babeliales bacterium]|nr:OmpA family protein [Candidatus Babeliales bacterium]
MNKKGSMLLLLALILGLPGCGGGDKKAKTTKAHDMSKKVAQAEGDSNMTLADAELSDESLRSFFDGMDEFVAMSDEELEQVADQFAWADADQDDLEAVYYAFGKTTADEEQAAKIAYNVEQAKKLIADARAEGSDAKLIVEGHACASAGTPEYNLAISEKRAQDVANRLVEAGLDRDAIKVVGRGNGMLVVTDGDREEQWPNRRVELHVLRA